MYLKPLFRNAPPKATEFAFAGGEPCEYPANFSSLETRIVVLPDATPNVTDRQTASGYCSGLHCEHCGRAVKTDANLVVSECTVRYDVVASYIIRDYFSKF